MDTIRPWFLSVNAPTDSTADANCVTNGVTTGINALPIEAAASSVTPSSFFI